MNEKELKALQEQITLEQKKQTEMVEALKTAHTEEVDKLVKKLDKADTDIKTLSLQADAIQIKLNEQGKDFGKEVDPFADMKKSMTSKDFMTQLKGRGGKAEFEVKVGNTMTASTNLSTGVFADRVPLFFREAGVGKAPDRIPTLLDLVSRGTISSDLDTWVERSGRTMSAASVAEGSPYIKSDLTYINKSQKVERLGHFYKVQNIALEDWDQFITEIQTEGYNGLEREIERQVYAGTGNTPEMLGITTNAAAFTAVSLTGIVTPNHYDALRAAIMQLRLAEYPALTAFVSPVEGAAMDLPKNAQGIYLMPPFADIRGKIISGVRVVESTLVTPGNVLIGDFSKDLLMFKRGIRVEIFDQNEDDAIYDRKTIVISCRCVNRIKTPDYNAFVFDQFSDIIAAIS
jgi:HK97 family phage major capsid protein